MNHIVKKNPNKKKRNQKSSRSGSRARDNNTKEKREENTDRSRSRKNHGERGRDPPVNAYGIPSIPDLSNAHNIMNFSMGHAPPPIASPPFDNANFN